MRALDAHGVHGETPIGPIYSIVSTIYIYIYNKDGAGFASVRPRGRARILFTNSTNR